MRYHVNGDLVPEESATVNVRDRGFAYGDAVFETMRAYDGRVFRWDAHADRLAASCDLLGIDHGIPDSDLHGRVRETLDANDLGEAYVKLSISRGVQPGTLEPSPVTDPTVVVIVSPLSEGVPWDDPATLETTTVQRTSKEAIPARAKTHNYLNGILARRAVESDEALLLDAEGYVTEGATSNVFFVSEGVLHTPSLDGPVLPGITRDTVLDLAADEGIPVEEGTYTVDDLASADELFLTNTTWEVRPVSRFDGREFETGPVTRCLQSAYRTRTRYSTWK